MSAAALKQSTAIIAPDPFCAGRRHVQIPPGLTLTQVIAQAAANDNLAPSWARGLLRVFVGGVEIPPFWWPRTRLKAGQHVAIMALPQGNSGKVFRTLLTIAVIAATAWVGGGGLVGLLGQGTLSGFTAGSVAASLAAAGVSLIGGVLVNAIAPAQNSAAAAQSQSYGLQGARNAARPWQPMNVVLGKRRVVPPLAATTYTETVGDDVWLRGLVQWHIGYGELSDIRIGETPIAAFEGVELEHRLQPGDPFPSLYPNIVREEQLQVALTSAGGWAQRRTQAKTTKISIDFGWPTGLLQATSSGNKSATVQLHVQYRAVDSGVWVNAPVGVGGVVTYTENKAASIRRSIEFAVTEGQYDVQILRVTADSTTTKVADDVYWVALRSFGDGAPFLLDTASLTAFRIKASGELNGTLDTLNGVFQMHAPLWDSEAGEFSELGATRNPAEIANWLALGPANDRPLTGRVDTVQLGSWAERCAEKDWKCDHIIDNGGTLEQALRIVAGCGRGFGAQWLDGKLAVAVDDVQDTPVQIFSARNVRNFTGTLSFPGELHAVNVQFADETNGYQTSTRTVYADGYNAANATLYETIDATGKTDPAEAYVVGWRYLAGRKLRPEGYAFDTDLEGLVVRIGQRSDISHYRMSVGIFGTRVRGLVLDVDDKVTGVVLDDVASMEAGKDYVLRVQSGSAIALLSLATVAGDSRTVSFPISLDQAAAPKVGDHVIFGEYGKETLPAIIVGIGVAPDKSSHLIAIPYAAALQADGGVIPDWDPLITPRALQAPALGVAVPHGDRIVTESLLADYLSERATRTELSDLFNKVSDFVGQGFEDRMNEIQRISQAVSEVALGAGSDIQKLSQRMVAASGQVRAEYTQQFTVAANERIAISQRIDQLNVDLAGKASASALAALTVQVEDNGESITAISADYLSLSAALDDVSDTIGPGYSPVATVASAIAAKADSSALTATADDLTALDATFGNIFASVKARFTAAAAPGDASARLAFSLSATDGGSPESAVFYMDALSAGGSRILMMASSIILSNGSIESSLGSILEFSGGTMYLASAAIKNASIDTLQIKNGAITDPVPVSGLNTTEGGFTTTDHTWHDLTGFVTPAKTYKGTGYVKIDLSGFFRMSGTPGNWQAQIRCLRSDGTPLTGGFSCFAASYPNFTGPISAPFYDYAPSTAAGVTYKFQVATVAGAEPSGTSSIQVSGSLYADEIKK